MNKFDYVIITGLAVIICFMMVFGYFGIKDNIDLGITISEYEEELSICEADHYSCEVTIEFYRDILKKNGLIGGGGECQGI